MILLLKRWRVVLLGWFAVCLLAAPLCGQTLDEQLRKEPTAELAAAAKTLGDPQRGAILFFQQHMACSKCHAVGEDKPNTLGPELTKLGKEVRDIDLVDSVLNPSQAIRKGFESVSVVTATGNTLAGILVERTEKAITIRDVARSGETVVIPAAEIEAVKPNPLSLMPTGQVNQLASRQQFLDLIRYLQEIRDGGATRARELQPSPTLLAVTVPEYENHLDHRGLIQSWDNGALKRGEAIYQRVCANCHGTKDRPGSLPNSLRFAEGKFKNGSDPFAMYQTLTRGFGFMVPQIWMVPSQKYDVIHYIRETYLRPHNPSQLVVVDAGYLDKLPKGDTRGPEPSKIQPWSAMDYGPNLTHTYEVPGAVHNFAYKGIAVRLDPGAGGISRGQEWLVFDTDTLRVAAAWTASGNAEQNFIDWRGIQFNGEHQIHPRIAGNVRVANGTGPGWANPADGSLADEKRVVGRDGKRYGPLPREWGQFRGVYQHGQQTVLSYTIGGSSVLELPGLVAREGAPQLPWVLRTFNIGPRERDLVLKVADRTATDAKLVIDGPQRSVVHPPVVAKSAVTPLEKEPELGKLAFNGGSYLEIPNDKAFDLTDNDFSIAARIKTQAGGTIFALSPAGDKWAPDGQTFFVRGGKLCFDVGWVGAISSKKTVNDGQWHQVIATWQKSAQTLRLYIDDKLDIEGKLAAKAKLSKSVTRIGFTTSNFPSPSYFQGELAEVRFYQKRLPDGGDLKEPQAGDGLVGRWLLEDVQGTEVADASGKKNNAKIVRGETKKTPAATEKLPLVAGFLPTTTKLEWQLQDQSLCLKIPAGKEPVKFTVWTTNSNSDFQPPPGAVAEVDLQPLTQGGPPRWPQKLVSQVNVGADAGPFAVDVLTPPDSNPWLALLRFTGLDFFADGRLAVCTWDGDVWIVEGPPGKNELHWQRIATGLFQPLGLKVIQDKIHVLCRDQLAVLHDLNDDREIDWVECLNNDHQVTEHFHEFAMGLQTDAAGDFYYAKSGRHALKAVVPHHGTLLKISRDGRQTEILATGFRAANGVCLNPDGSFVVTDQEGFWNPKNRINWVTRDPSGKPKFYGNMFGYHDVTDSSDEAMEPPLCWITNEFDRSPAELLWVQSEKWGKLNGSLLNLSYGTGKVFLVPHEKVQGKMQGGMIELPIPSFPTGVMRGRFHPGDGQLYLCGMFAWAGSAQQPGGLYRLRATGESPRLPIELHAVKTGVKLTFTDPLAADAVAADKIKVKVWGLKRTANYGSKHIDEHLLTVMSAKLSADGRTLSLEIPDIQPTWGMEVKYDLRSADGRPVVGVIHNTIHQLGE